MALVSDRCICLRVTEYSETSQILTLLTRRHGLVRSVAKGAHRRTKDGASRFGGGIDLLEVGDAVFTDSPDKDLATLTEWRLREGHPCLRKTLRGIYLGFYAAELVSLLIETHDPHVELFDRLEQALLEFGSPRAEQAFLAFQLALLRETGYLPELGRCASCGQAVADRTTGSFVLPLGGIVCRTCEAAYPQRVPFDGRLLNVMRSVLGCLGRGNGSAARLPVLTRHQTDPINRLLAEYMQHTLGRRLRTTPYVLR